MTWVVHSLGTLSRFALLLGVIAGLVAWLAVKLWASSLGSSKSRSHVKLPAGIAVTVTLAVGILGVSPGSGRRFPAEGTFEGWTWRWFGDLPDAFSLHVLNNYTAAIALLNFGLFAAWGVVVSWGWGIARRKWALLSVILFPICLELLQRYLFGGTPSVTDAWTNILGGLFGLLVWGVVASIASRQSPQ